MTTIAVLDVNILASAAATKDGLPGILADYAVDGVYRLALSEHMLKTLWNVLSRPYFALRLDHEQRDRFLMRLEDVAMPVEADPLVRGVCDDGEDDLVLGTAVAAEADYLVTGDKGFLRVEEYRGVRIVSAAGFLVLIRQELA